MRDATLRRLTVLAAILITLPLAAGACDGGGGTPTTTTGELALTAAIAPDPPTTGQNTLTITVRDANGAPVLGATVTVVPEMPMMGHGSSETAVVTEVGGGVYTAFPVTFQMPGSWKVTVTASAGAMAGTTTLDYTVE